MSTLEELERAASTLTIPPVGAEADWLGRVNKVLRDLGAVRKLVMDELDGPVAGQDYRVVEGRKAVRSYNSAALLKAFAEKGWELRDLMNADAVRLGWRWTETKRAATDADVTLRIAAHEVTDFGDLEEEMIGEVWRSEFKVEGK